MPAPVDGCSIGWFRKPTEEGPLEPYISPELQTLMELKDTLDCHMKQAAAATAGLKRDQEQCLQKFDESQTELRQMLVAQEEALGNLIQHSRTMRESTLNHEQFFQRQEEQMRGLLEAQQRNEKPLPPWLELARNGGFVELTPRAKIAGRKDEKDAFSSTDAGREDSGMTGEPTGSSTEGDSEGSGPREQERRSGRSATGVFLALAKEHMQRKKASGSFIAAAKDVLLDRVSIKSADKKEKKKRRSESDEEEVQPVESRKSKKKKRKSQNSGKTGEKSGKSGDETSDMTSAPVSSLVRTKSAFLGSQPHDAKNKQGKVDEIMARWKIPEGLKRFIGNTNGPFSCLVKARLFRILVNLIIFGNCVFIGVQAQHRVTQARVGQAQQDTYNLVDLAFSAAFGVELLLRVVAERISLFILEDWRWNAMDFLLVILDISNQLVWLFVLAEGQGAQFAYFSSARGAVRALRLARASRALRLFRAVRKLSTARLLVEQVVGGIDMALHVGLLLGVLLLFGAVILMQATADSLMSDKKSAESETMFGLFGDMGKSVVSLFQITSGGLSWAFVYETVDNVSGSYGVLFLVFVYFALFVFANCVTAVFVQSALAASKVHEMEGKVLAGKYMPTMISAADTSNDGMVSLEELREHLNRPLVQQHLMTLGLDASETCGIFHLLATAGADQVPIDELKQGCIRFTRPVRSADFVAIHLAHKKLAEDIQLLHHMIEHRFHAMGLG